MTAPTVEPVDHSFGAILRDVQLDPLTDEVVEAVRAAIRERLVVVIKPAGGPQTDEALLALARAIGPDLQDHDKWGLVIPLIGQPDENGRVEGVGTPNKALEWHTDYSYDQRPAKETLLHAVTLSSNGGATSFIDMYRALETLPDELRAYVDEHDAAHSIGVYEGHPEYQARGANEVHHPLAFPHPETGRKALYASPLLTKRVVGLPADESAQVLEALFAHAIEGAEIYAHRWEVGDLVVFDAVGTIHRREPYGGTGRRHLREISTLV